MILVETSSIHYKNAISTNISFVRFIAMCFIILCHIFQYYGWELAWWFNVGVQMFFFISGFLYGNKDICDSLDFIKKNFKKILIPYYCFLLPVILLYYLFSRDDISFRIVIKSLLCAQTIKGLGHLWFVSYILFCYVITPYLYFLKKKLQDVKMFKFFWCFFIVLVLGDRLFSSFNSYFCFDRVWCYIAGYFAMMFLEMYGFKMFKKVSKLVVLVAILMNLLRVLFKYFFEFSFSGFVFFESYCHAILGAALVLVVIIYVKGIKLCRLFEFSDKYSYYIYIVHQLFILSPFTLLAVTSNLFVNLFLMITSTMLSAVVLRLISENVKKLRVFKK